ncbi:hypothetical protein HDU79_009296 [Rhizoclosmatium sp. JEL0117]|nr:hypothetical protein HDU79_009296 [Rhizoclosmatium sp. JEL0117]
MDRRPPVRTPLPKRIEVLLLLLILICVVLGLVRPSASASASDSVHEIRNFPARDHINANKDSSVKVRGGFSVASEDELRSIIDEEVRKELGKNLKLMQLKQQPQIQQQVTVSEPEDSFDFAAVEAQIDLLQIQFLDYLNGEEGVEQDSALLFGGSLLHLESPFDIRGTWRKLAFYAKTVPSLPHNRTDFLELGRRTRANLIAYTILYDRPSLIPILCGKLNPTLSDVTQFQNDLKSTIDAATKILYPWLSPTYPTLRAMQSAFVKGNEDGIVLCSGKWHFEMAVHAITTIRKALKSTLPVEVHYGGPDDLTPEMIKAFNSIENVKTVNILEYFPTETKLWGGWSMKPFAMLISRFRRLIFIDADALFFQDPRVLLTSSKIVSQYGQMFYHDRTLGGNDPWWFKSINPHYSHYSTTLRYMQKDKPGSSQHEMESGVVVIDKGRTGVLHALMTVCKMNSKYERDELTYHRVYGDKETYWISWDLIRVPYRFTPSYGGTVGYKNERDHVCGGLFHTDEQFRPLWWNGGVMANKHISKDAEFMKFEYAAFDVHAQGIDWEWETKTTPFCLKPKDPVREVVMLSDEEKRLGAEFVELYKEIKLGEGGWKEYFKRVYKVEF